MKRFVVFSVSIFVLFLATPLLFAQGACTPVYGGGLQENGSPYCLEQVSAQGNTQTSPTQQSGFTTPNDGSTSSPLTKGGQPSTLSTGSTATKGGLSVYPSPNVASNPNTGPELFGLAALIPTGALGYLLRRKTSA